MEHLDAYGILTTIAVELKLANGISLTADPNNETSPPPAAHLVLEPAGRSPGLFGPRTPTSSMLDL